MLKHTASFLQQLGDAPAAAIGRAGGFCGVNIEETLS